MVLDGEKKSAHRARRPRPVTLLLPVPSDSGRRSLHRDGDGRTTGAPWPWPQGRASPPTPPGGCGGPQLPPTTPGAPAVHASSLRIAGSFLGGKSQTTALGRGRENPNTSLGFLLKHKLEKKPKSALLALSGLPSGVSPPGAPGHHSWGSPTPKDTMGAARRVSELGLASPTLLPAPTAASSSTQSAAGESRIWATDLQWESRAGGHNRAPHTSPESLRPGLLPPWCHQAQHKRSPERAAF